jgi:transposase InsO family protein
VNYCCELFGRTKQAYYKGIRRDKEQIPQVIRIVDAVRQIRELDQGIGYYKLWLMMKQLFLADRVPGRDAFLRLLREFHLMQNRPNPRHTTNSNHRFRKYKNLIRGFVPTGPNQLWVSDITYIDLAEGCSYLHLVTDAYSHKIVGWTLSESLESQYTLEALRMAISQASAEELRELIHHSDRGVQYCSTVYTEELKKYQIRISMTEDYKPTDNAIAERVNGIIKTEVIYRERRFKSIEDARERVSCFIRFYNENRPHSSIGMKVPSQAHTEHGLQQRMWKTRVNQFSKK